MPQDPLPEKIVDILVAACATQEEGPFHFKTDRERADCLEVCRAAVSILDAWAISRGLIKGPTVPDRAFDMARQMLGQRLKRPGIGIWRSRDDNGWTAHTDIVAESDGRTCTYHAATVTDAEVAAELAKEDAANGR